MSTVLVTAALGNVGREVVRACRASGLTVRAAHHDLERARQAFLPDASGPAPEVVRLDFLDRSSWAAALDGCEQLFLLRPPPLGDMEATLLPFLDEAYRRGVKHVVFLSVAGAEKLKWIPHRKVELHLERHGPDWTLLRCGFFAQNFEAAYQRDIVEDARLFVPAGHGRVAFIDVRDVGDAAAAIFAAPERWKGLALTLTGPEAITFSEAARLLSEVRGSVVRYEPASVAGYAWHLRRNRGLPWMQIVVQTILHVGLRRGDAEAVGPDLARCLGRPATDLPAYVARQRERFASAVPALGR